MFLRRVPSQRSKNALDWMRALFHSLFECSVRDILCIVLSIFRTSSKCHALNMCFRFDLYVRSHQSPNQVGFFFPKNANVKMCSNWIDLELFYSRVATFALCIVLCALRVYFAREDEVILVCDKVQSLRTFYFGILDTSKRQVTHKLYNK